MAAEDSGPSRAAPERSRPQPFAGGLWTRFWERAPRQLTITTEGKVVIGVALAVGLAAMNTGNNLLFLGWGLVLSAIVLSGLLSEATLKPLSLEAGSPGEARVAEVALVPIIACNTAKRLPAFGVETVAHVARVGRSPEQGGFMVPAGFELRMSPGVVCEAHARFVPARRGLHRLVAMVAKTSYPFGFFTKSRRMTGARPTEFWVFPEAVDVRFIAPSLLSRLGEAAVPVSGMGDDFFALRPYRVGDDVRRVYWRRVARTGRWVVVENEARSGVAVILELYLGDLQRQDDDEVEHAIATLGSLAEALLAHGMQVGVRAPGLSMLPEGGAGQRRAILWALARLDGAAAMPNRSRFAEAHYVALIARAGVAHEAATAVIDLDAHRGVP
ncbi:MAG: DUF58 domain-containing protein [Deltaproteobacteria bacterium]|nr:DUF58 domain-containing protein [Deltaproteobacteria bacterium]